MYNTKNKKSGTISLPSVAATHTHRFKGVAALYFVVAVVCFSSSSSPTSLFVCPFCIFFLSRAAAAELSKFITRGVDATNGYVARSSFASHDLAHERKSFLFRLFPKMKKRKNFFGSVCVDLSDATTDDCL